MAASGIDIDELVIPDWRDGRAYARAQGDKAVANQVKGILSSQQSTQASVTLRSAEDEIERFYPQLTGSLRITDLRDWRYWLTMIGICAFFLVVELVVILSSGTNNDKLVLVQKVLAFGLLVPVFFLLIAYVWATLSCKSGGELPSALRWFRPKWLHMLPVLWLAVGLMIVNFWLVIETGWRQSPFLPAFLAAALTVIGLPRENSKLIVYLSLLAGALGIVACLWSTSLDEKALKTTLEAWGAGDNGHLPFYINAMTFGVAVLLTMVLRRFSLRMGET